MKRTFSALFVSILLAMGLVSCGGYSAPRTTGASGIPFRIFVSNPFNPTITGANFPGLDIIDASKDVLSFFQVSLLGSVTSAGMMVESPNRDRTVVFSPTTSSSTTNTLAIVDNAKETATGTVNLPGATESMFVAGNGTTLFAAIPTAAVSGQPAGAIVVVDISKPAITATVPVRGAHYLIPSPDGNQVLAVSDSANSVTVFSPAVIGTGTGVGALTPVSGTFDRPVWAVFSSDGSTAYVMNCGPQCGGITASIGVVDMTQTPPLVTATVPVAAATMGMLNGGNLYVVGTPLSSGTDCSANLCGVLTVFPEADVTAAPTTFAVTDGYHNRIVPAPNNQLFIASRTCTDVIATTSTPSRGCLSVFDTGTGKVYTAARNGDVTGIQPIDHRTQVYVCEGGNLQIYDTAQDIGSGNQLQLQSTQISISGQAIDVKLADFD